jgi:hypothetical protein
VNKQEYNGEATKEFIYEADKYDVEFPIPPQEKGMKNKIKWFALGALAVALIAFSSTARAAGAEDVLLGVVAGVIIGDQLNKEPVHGSAGYIDLTQYNITMVAPDGTLVLTPITKSKRRKAVEPPCARSSRGTLPRIPGQKKQHYWIPKCPNWSMMYGGLIVLD